jgi:hypothetical protein
MGEVVAILKIGQKVASLPTGLCSHYDVNNVAYFNFVLRDGSTICNMVARYGRVVNQ